VNDDLTTRYDGVLERTAEGGAIRFERHLAYDVRDVWDAITNPARLAEWWLPFDAEITIDLREGGEMVFAGTPDGEPVTMTCTILRIEPPLLFEHTHPAPGSRMRWSWNRPIPAASSGSAISSPASRKRSTTATSLACRPPSLASRPAWPADPRRGTGPPSPPLALTTPASVSPLRRTHRDPPGRTASRVSVGVVMSNAKSAHVETFLTGLTHCRKSEIQSLRDAILASPTAMTERVKWNAPSFCHDGDDRVTFRLQPGDRVELVFHRGAKKRTDSASFEFVDPTGLMSWSAPDRGVIVLSDAAATEASSAAIVWLVAAWMAATSDR